MHETLAPPGFKELTFVWETHGTNDHLEESAVTVGGSVFNPIPISAVGTGPERDAEENRFLQTETVKNQKLG